MGKRGTYCNVEARENKIRVRFFYLEERCSETLNLAPTPPNLRYAARLAKEIAEKIKQGSFDYATYFPESRRITALGAPSKRAWTFEQTAEAWYQATSSTLAKGTRIKYRQALDNFWLPKLGERRIRAISHLDLKLVVNTHKWPSSKHRNNTLIPGRRIFDLATQEEIIDRNPFNGIKNLRVQRPIPDPCTLQEAERILQHMAKVYGDEQADYFEFAFFTGVRPEEQIALQWNDIDWSYKQAMIQRALTAGEMKTIKTVVARTIELNDRALSVLTRQRPRTELKSDFVFQHSITGKPYTSETYQRDAIWTPTLRALKIRHRRAYQTRHTYATLCLMEANTNPLWLAKQLGHSVQMLYSTYAKWIERADKSREINKTNETFAAKKLPQAGAIVGQKRGM